MSCEDLSVAWAGLTHNSTQPEEEALAMPLAGPSKAVSAPQQAVPTDLMTPTANSWQTDVNDSSKPMLTDYQITTVTERSKVTVSNEGGQLNALCGNPAPPFRSQPATLYEGHEMSDFSGDQAFHLDLMMTPNADQKMAFNSVQNVYRDTTRPLNGNQTYCGAQMINPHGSQTFSGGQMMASTDLTYGAQMTPPNGNQTFYDSQMTIPNGSNTFYEDQITHPGDKRTLFGGQMTTPNGDQIFYGSQMANLNYNQTFHCSQMARHLSVDQIILGPQMTNFDGYCLICQMISFAYNLMIHEDRFPNFYMALPLALRNLLDLIPFPRQPQKKHVCDYGNCRQAYSKSSHLRAHKRKHTGEKPYKCPEVGCTWSFCRSDELSRHKRKHTGNRPFQCPYCNKNFARSDHLRQHEKQHR